MHCYFVCDSDGMTDEGKYNRRSKQDSASMEGLSERMARLKERASAPNSPKRYMSALMAASEEMEKMVAEGADGYINPHTNSQSMMAASP